MPSKKTERSSERKRSINIRYRAATRTIVGKAVRLIESGELDVAEVAVADGIRILDKASTKGLIHKNNAARRKSRLISRLNASKSTQP